MSVGFQNGCCAVPLRMHRMPPGPRSTYSPAHRFPQLGRKPHLSKDAPLTHTCLSNSHFFGGPLLCHGLYPDPNDCRPWGQHLLNSLLQGVLAQGLQWRATTLPGHTRHELSSLLLIASLVCSHGGSLLPASSSQGWLQTHLTFAVSS